MNEFSIRVFKFNKNKFISGRNPEPNRVNSGQDTLNSLITLGLHRVNTLKKWRKSAPSGREGGGKWKKQSDDSTQSSDCQLYR